MHAERNPGGIPTGTGKAAEKEKNQRFQLFAGHQHEDGDQGREKQADAQTGEQEAKDRKSTLAMAKIEYQSEGGQRSGESKDTDGGETSQRRGELEDDRRRCAQ